MLTSFVNSPLGDAGPEEDGQPRPPGGQLGLGAGGCAEADRQQRHQGGRAVHGELPGETGSVCQSGLRVRGHFVVMEKIFFWFK